MVEVEVTKAENDAFRGYESSFDVGDHEEVKDFNDLPNDDVRSEWGHYGGYEVVGHGEVTDKDKCGKFLAFYGCLRTDLHAIVSLDGRSHKGKVFIRKVFHSCDKPSCPVCYRRGWAVKEASNIESRLKEASKMFGFVEHVVVSVPENDYGLTFEQLRVKIVKILAARGILGGVHIFHGFRYHDAEVSLELGVDVGYYWSPHFHVLGFVEGGYGQCRGCSNVWRDFRGECHVIETSRCLACDGFEGRTRRMYDKEGGRSGSGYIVKVMGARKSIHGTAWYQLNHSSIVSGSERSHVATWFGTCSYRKLKLEKSDRIDRGVCPICQHDLVRVRYHGCGLPLAEFWIREFEDKDLDNSGQPNWVEAVGGSPQYRE